MTPYPNSRANVPCNGCTACCGNDLLMLHPEMGDDPALYETTPATNPVTGEAGLALKHNKADGSCFYLGEGGCEIHDRAPAICREFDCRGFYKRLLETTTRGDRRRMVRNGVVGADVLAAGRKRLAA